MKPLEYIADPKAYKMVNQVASSYYWSLHKAAYDHGGDRDTVLIKIFDIYQKDDINMYSLITEMFVAKKCGQHVNIVPSVRCYFKEQNQLFIVMSDYREKPLPSISIFKRGLPEEIVAFVIMEVLKALEWMHEKGNRVHGDLQWTNVFLDKEGNVKVEFPTWLTNPELEIHPSLEMKHRRSDFSMVGTLAHDLFNGKETSSGCFAASAKKKQQPELLGDFVKFCDSCGPVTIKDLMSHKFLEKFCHFDRYKQDLKVLLRKKLRPRISSLFPRN